MCFGMKNTLKLKQPLPHFQTHPTQDFFNGGSASKKPAKHVKGASFL